jgi:vanillate/3-O-methylgallate O-demethylase
METKMSTTTRPESLQEAIERAGSAVSLLRNSPARPTTFPVTPEFTNWRTEQHAWRDACALFDQSHHMTDLFLKGPDAFALLAGLAVNSFANFTPGKAKQFIAVSPDGYVIGDAILFHLPDGTFDLVGHPMALDWVQFHAETGNLSVEVQRDDNSAVRASGPPQLFRYELQGPTAAEIIQAVTGESVPEVRFFNMTSFEIAGLRVDALRHGMAGQPGFELFGPWQEADRVRTALLEAGAPFGLAPAGAKAYSTANLESGWVPSPLPAIFSGPQTADYRAWLPAARAGSLAGSYAPSEIADYYLRPHELGYGKVIAFDHDFVGREALEQLETDALRQKVTLVWNGQDIAAATATLFEADAPKAKYIELPKARYGLYQVDTVLVDGEPVGISHDCGYLANESAFASLASLDSGAAAVGTEVTVIWGEQPNSAKPQVEEHRQVEIRATVAPTPFAGVARTQYRTA